MASTWSKAFLISLGMIGFAVAAAGKKRRNRDPSEPPSTSSSSYGINHEVFLSFRGKDIRTTFANLIHVRLKSADIEVFKDDHNLRPGDEINQGLKDAIKRSRISIAIFSKDYASSKSCLMELVQMWECRESNGQIVIPIFYDVSPYDVKHQSGAFAKSFQKHEADETVDSNTIGKWKEVLQKIGVLSGFDRALINGGNVADLLEKVVTRVCQELEKDDLRVTDKLVGIDPHVQQMMTKLGVVYSNGEATKVCGEDVRVVRICGIPGVGKTTLAKLVFNKMHELFDGRCSFVEVKNLRGASEQSEILEGVKPSQELLIAGLRKEKPEPLTSYDKGRRKIGSQFSNMKVLIVLDDVNKVEQIEGLVGDLKWFGLGSRIIVTTDQIDVFDDFILRFPGAVIEHRVKPLGYNDALELFGKHAFRGKAPQYVSDHESLAIAIVNALGGLPLAIKVTGSYLCKQSGVEGILDSEVEEIWNATLDYSRKKHTEPVKAALEASYRFLDLEVKEIFLDIACFFNGKDKRIPSYMWKSHSFFPPIVIKLLRDRCLLEIGENNELKMNAVLRDFGRKQSKDLSKRCRFWNFRESIPADVEGIGSVVGIGLTVKDDRPFTCEQYRQMSKLRYLGLYRAKILGNTQNLPKNLSWLEWRECHSIPKLDNMKLEKLVILDVSRSEVTKDSEFWGQIRKKVKKLKVLNLQGCRKLHASFNFPAPAELEILILEDCTQLFNIGQFIRELKNLSSLNLRNCSLVTKLPRELYCMKSLTELLIDGTGIESIDIKADSLQNLEKLSACGCTNLKYISPIGHLVKLESLALDGANIDWDPTTFEFPPNLRRLSLRECRMFDELPTSIGQLKGLEEMDLSNTGIKEMPPSVQHLSSLKKLKMEGTHLEKFPEEIVKLGKLEEIDFSGCTHLEWEAHCDISGLSSLGILRLSSSNVAALPESIRHLSRLQTLDLSKCKQLQALPELPSSLLSLRWGSRIMEIPILTNLRNLTNLKVLCLIHDEQPAVESSNQTPDIWWITGLTSLETLEVSLRNVTNLPGNLSALTQLRELTLSYMKELDLTQLPSSSSLLTLRLRHCKIQVPKFSGLQLLSELELEECDLAEIDGLKDITLLEVLKVFGCNRITNLDGLKDLQRLRKVQGTFSARPRLPKLSDHVELDMTPQDPSLSVA